MNLIPALYRPFSWIKYPAGRGICGAVAFLLACSLPTRADTHPPALPDTPDAVDPTTPTIPLPPPNPPPRVQQENGKPIFGVFNDGGPKGLEQYEEWLGRPADAILLYTGDRDWNDYQGSIGWGLGLYHKFDRRFLHSVAFMPKKGTSLAEAAKGSYNGEWKKAAETILKGHPEPGVIYIRTAWEFNGNWFHYNAVHKEQNFIGAWRQFVSTFRSVSDRFRFDWCPGGTIKLSMKAEDAYPGDDYVDIIGMDVYDQAKWPIFKDPAERWDKVIINGDHGLAWLKDFAAQHNKPMSIPEWGASGDQSGDDPYFVEHMYQWCVDNHVIYASYWNSASTYKGSVSMGQNPNAAAKYKEIFGSTAIANPGPSRPVAPAPPAAAPAPTTNAPSAEAPSPSPSPSVAATTPDTCTIVQVAPIEAYGADGQMTGVGPSVVGQGYQRLRVEGDKTVLQDAKGQIFKIRTDAVSKAPTATSPPGN